MRFEPIIRLMVWVSCLLRLGNTQLSAQRLTIDRQWRFQPGDSLIWASLSYRDAHWQSLKTGLWWGHAGITHTGFSWYRKTLIVPATLRAAVQKRGYLRLSLGQIQDADQAFLNGRVIGQTGSFMPYRGRWEKQRYYLLKADQINWNKPNTIAVRVFAQGDNGGMHTGPYFLEPYAWSLHESVQIARCETRLPIQVAGPAELCLALTTTLPNPCRGVVTFQLSDHTGRQLNRQAKRVILQPGTIAHNRITFACSLPAGEVSSAHYVFTDDKSGQSVEGQQFITTITTVSLPVLPAPVPLVPPKVRDAFKPAQPDRQEIGGVLGERMAINVQKRLIQIDEQGLLDGYLNRPGRQIWVGEHVGKYLEAACNAWQYTHDSTLKAQMDRILLVLLRTQRADGYLGTYTPDAYWTSWDVWTHKYNLMGLLAYYKATGYRPALEAAKRIGNLLCRTFGKRPEQQSIVLSGTHVGMASASVLDPITDLYFYTGDPTYLAFARYIVDAYDEPDGPHLVSDLLAGKPVHQIANGKAYEMLSNLVGLIKLYKLTGTETYLTAVQKAWQDIVPNRLYITGALSSYELFRADHVLPADDQHNMGEGCVTTTWLQLNQQLFSLTGELPYLNQIEKSVYNQLLGAENPQDGCVSYYTPLMGRKPYSCGITCCLSSVARGITLIPFVNYGQRAGVPTLLFSESQRLRDTIATREHPTLPISIRVDSDFPHRGHIQYVIAPSQPAVFPIALRVPGWAVNYTANIGTEVYNGRPNEYLTIERRWQPTDTLRIQFEMLVTVLNGGESYPDHIALQRGPQILSVDRSMGASLPIELSLADLSGANLQKMHSGVASLPAGWIGKQAYLLSVAGATSSGLSLVPFADASQMGASATVWIPVKTN